MILQVGGGFKYIPSHVQPYLRKWYYFSNGFVQLPEDQ